MQVYENMEGKRNSDYGSPLLEQLGKNTPENYLQHQAMHSNVGGALLGQT